MNLVNLQTTVAKIIFYCKFHVTVQVRLIEFLNLQYLKNGRLNLVNYLCTIYKTASKFSLSFIQRLSEGFVHISLLRNAIIIALDVFEVPVMVRLSLILRHYDVSVDGGTHQPVLQTDAVSRIHSVRKDPPISQGPLLSGITRIGSHAKPSAAIQRMQDRQPSFQMSPSELTRNYHYNLILNNRSPSGEYERNYNFTSQH